MCRTPHGQEHVQRVLVRVRDRSELSSFEQWCLPGDYTHAAQLEANWTYYPGLQYPLFRFAHWYLPPPLAIEQAALEVRPLIDMGVLWKLPWCRRQFDRAPAYHQPTQQR
jgi:hypothetical protein